MIHFAYFQGFQFTEVGSQDMACRLCKSICVEDVWPISRRLCLITSSGYRHWLALEIRRVKKMLLDVYEKEEIIN
ncbi:hypothetical protein CAEBREN_13825 [Caenorhabditis brenneri]|uniref:Uncharacterized protein n=1 Tax=Caenorhabditis brenneri TaxID=135651 RepID=G0NNR3_CAEBE|nr:hypothetical protein CAEBREN_13825 [Caenorhabditis brenneri]